jgi:hypothetical protein
MSNPPTRRRHLLVALAIAAAVTGAAGACTSTTEVADPTTTTVIPSKTGTSVPSGGTDTTRAPGTTVRGTTPGTVRRPDSDGPGDDDEPTGDETADQYADALVSSFRTQADEDEIFTLDVVECVSPLWIDAVGVEAFQAAGVTPAELESGASGLEDVSLDQASAEAIVDAVPGCGLPLIDLFIDGLGSRAQDDPAVRTCVEGAVTDAQMRAVLVDQIRGVDGDDPKDLVDQCLI